MAHVKRRTRRFLFILFVVITALLAVFIEARIPKRRCSNPYSSLAVRGENRDALQSLERVDADGYLYEITFAGDFEDDAPRLILRLLKLVRTRGCTAFAAQTQYGATAVARNYDFPHYDENGERDAVLVAVHCQPDGKYASVGTADAYLLANAGKDMTHGVLDDGRSDNSLLCMLPYICVDGINEKGFCVSVEYIPLKDGESPVNQNERGKERVVVTQLVRMLLDNCATVEEAETLAASVNLVNTAGNDYHLLVADANGTSAVFEWRNNTFAAVDTEIATNFYVGSDDAADFFEDGEAKEAYPGAADTKTAYRYGFGYGYERFNIVARALDECTRAANGRAVLTEEKILSVLADARQDGGNGTYGSFTQCTTLFDLDECTMVLRPLPTYENAYGFGVSE